MHRRDNGTAQACPPGTPVHRLEACASRWGAVTRITLYALQTSVVGRVFNILNTPGLCAAYGLSGSRMRHSVPLHGRRGPRRPSILWLGRAALHAVKPCRLWLLGWRDADASLCSRLLAAMPRPLGRRLERNSAGRSHCCAPECWRHRVSRCV